MDLLKIGEVAEMIGVPEATLRWWRATDRGPRCGKLGRRIIYRRADVLEWVDEQLRASGGPRG